MENLFRRRESVSNCLAVVFVTLGRPIDNSIFFVCTFVY